MAKNAVEEYIYSIREKICEELEPYILEADREAYSRKLTETEDWLYEDGEECEDCKLRLTCLYHRQNLPG